ncbi:uncharacterized protein PHACADRAFT_263407 [Phanerochaete carnosa HHB-10118-sp]|uniref:F-box domain-containing protein n=1 Tax=Phanerochaete carnosa (strain HHB-10118-sp) TaxID=650164 RepID=K5VX41_PHACS|nr:uncharacterized protein PHACADRAFT_263407 [Phanerochaete carnosa HHB-10118-sp]EKM51345.1 hypothetical protein PHACADRAFT_263407 [Phanerochaete carnosa HHB-10118-sp]
MGRKLTIVSRGRMQLARFLGPSSPTGTAAASNVVSLVACSVHLEQVVTPVCSSCTTPTLPQELWDMVIDYLHDDRITLLTCSIVCRSWLPSSLLHLDGHIRVQIPFMEPVTDGPYNLKQCDTDILARVSRPQHVSSLTIKWNTSKRDPPRPRLHPHYSIILHNNLSLAIQAMPNLVSLTMIGLRIRYPRHPPESKDVVHFFQAALQLPRLREITMVGATLAEYPDVPHLSPDVEVAPSLEKVSIRESAMNGITLAWLYSLLLQTKDPRRSSTSLRHLDIPSSFLSFSMQGHFSWYTSLLLSLGHGLHHLGLQFGPVHGANGQTESILTHPGVLRYLFRHGRLAKACPDYSAFLGALSRCVNVRFLDLFLHGPDQAAVAKAVFEYLTTLPNTPPITEVGIALRMPCVDTKDRRRALSRATAALRALDSLLCGLGQVRCVTIRPTLTGGGMYTTGESNSSEARRACEGAGLLWKHLPKLRKRGILRME